MTAPPDLDHGSPDEPATPPGRPRRPLRVLLVDDHLLIRCNTRQQLEDIPNLQVVAEATDGFEAIALARTLSPDIVLMDIAMPVLDGIEATRRITAEFPNMRVIMLSSYEEESFKRKAKEAGAHAYLVKGQNVERLAEAIRKAIGRR